MGLDMGFELEGFQIQVALDKDPSAVETLRRNRPNTPVIWRNVFDVETS